MKFAQLFFIKLLLFLGIIGRLLYLQYFGSAYFKTLAHHNHIHTHLIPNERGIITDHTGVILADNVSTYKGFIMAYDKKEFDLIAEKANRIVPIPETPRYKRRTYILAYPHLTWEEMTRLETADIGGLKIESTFKRFYESAHFAPTLGYVSIARETDQLNIPGLYVGRGIGLESAYNAQLEGEHCCVQDEVDARGRFIQTLDKDAGLKGHDLKTTLSAPLQNFICNYLKARTDIKSAAVIVMDAHTGAIRSLVSYPLFDPNPFVSKISTKEWKRLQDNAFKPLYNKALQGVYSPGSVFKLVVLLTALEKGIKIPDVFCKGYIENKGCRRYCASWRRGGHGTVNMEKALSHSCDIYFYELAKHLSLYDVMKTATRLGYGDITGIDINGEKKGKMLSFFECFKEDPCHAFIGQGKLLATPLQITVMMASLVSGSRVTPHLVSKNQPTPHPLGIHKNHLKTLQEQMLGVTKVGTGRSALFYTESGDIGLAGKTGTTQVCKILQAERDQGQIHRQHFLKDHAIFSGFGPVSPTSKPQYVITVVIEHGGSGALAAGVAKDIMRFVTTS